MSNSLDPDQDQRIAGSGLGPNYLQMLSAGGRSTNNHTSVSYGSTEGTCEKNIYLVPLT